jgi:hypothetical protein
MPDATGAPASAGLFVFASVGYQSTPSAAEGAVLLLVAFPNRSVLLYLSPTWGAEQGVVQMKKLLIAACAAAAVLLAPPAWPNTISLHLDQALFNVAPGDTVIVSGELTQTSPDTFIINKMFLNLGACATFFATCPISPDPAFASIFGTPLNSLTLYSGPLVDLNLLASAPTSSSVTLQFAFDLTLSASGTTLDVQPLFTINVTTVPEPSIWAMMLLGFAGLGSLAYCRKNRLAKTAT